MTCRAGRRDIETKMSPSVTAKHWLRRRRYSRRAPALPDSGSVRPTTVVCVTTARPKTCLSEPMRRCSVDQLRQRLRWPRRMVVGENRNIFVIRCAAQSQRKCRAAKLVPPIDGVFDQREVAPLSHVSRWVNQDRKRSAGVVPRRPSAERMMLVGHGTRERFVAGHDSSTPVLSSRLTVRTVTVRSRSRP